MISRRSLVVAAILARLPGVARAQASAVGVVLMHGKWGNPEKGIEPVELALKGVGCRVISREMPWSDRRAYDAGWDEVMTQLDAEVAELRAAGARKIVVGGMSFGANVALGYAARHPDLDGVMALAPGHTPERFASNKKMAESLAKARSLAASGNAGGYANFDDINQGRMREVSARPAVYLSYFDPDGPAVMPRSAAMLSPHTALLWVVGTRDPLHAAGRSYAFDRAPANPHSSYQTVDADHFDTPAAARQIVVEWVKGLP
jgi:pimeloyl-ACP methyl ester carboxylesterase